MAFDLGLAIAALVDSLDEDQQEKEVGLGIDLEEMQEIGFVEGIDLVETHVVEDMPACCFAEDIVGAFLEVEAADTLKMDSVTETVLFLKNQTYLPSLTHGG